MINLSHTEGMATGAWPFFHPAWVHDGHSVFVIVTAAGVWLCVSARMDDVKGHGMYKGLDWEGLVAKVIPAPWVPEGPAPRSEPESIPCANDVYSGEQARWH